jgi:hypothetical protein
MSSAAVGGEPARASRSEMRDFAAGECAVEDGEISHDNGEEAEAHAAFENEEDARERAVRRDVAEAEGEEGGSADVEVGAEVRGLRGVDEGTADGVVDEGEAEDHDCGPDDEKKNERERTVVAEKDFAAAGMVKAASEEAPGKPGGDVEEAGEAEAAGGAAGQDDGLEGIEEHDRDAEEAGNQSEGAHWDSVGRASGG